GRHDVVRADERDVDGEVMPAELDHPWGRCRRNAKKRNVVFVKAKPNAAASRPAGTNCSLTASGASAARILQHFVTVHDVSDLLVALGSMRTEQARARLRAAASSCRRDEDRCAERSP